MSVRPECLEWLKRRHGVGGGAIYCSRLYTAEQSWTSTAAWSHEIRLSRLRNRTVRYVRLVCQLEEGGFIYLRIPKRSLEQVLDQLEVSKRSIRLHLSAAGPDRFTDLRGPGRVDFAEYVVDAESRAPLVPPSAPTKAPKVLRYTVYVVELAPESVVTNPSGLPPLYVGQTAHSPEYRFEQHKAGGKTASRRVFRYGIELRPDLSARVAPFRTRMEAESAEAALALELEKRGHRVFWG